MALVRGASASPGFLLCQVRGRILILFLVKHMDSSYTL